jgi:hypothetical protein
MAVRIKFILAIVAGILLCTVCTQEIPELLRLADDTSNDFSLVAVEGVVPHAVEAAERRTDFTPAVASTKPRREATARFQSRCFGPSIDEVLHSLCVLRT